LQSVDAKEADDNDLGTRAGYQAITPPSIPSELRDYVTSVSLEPPATLFQHLHGDHSND
jgi:hypothetical protein